MRVGRIGLFVGVSLALVAGVALAWGIAVVRTCDENANVRRGSLPFRLCGIDGELIASIPLRDPQGEVLYSWQSADGNKPGRKWLSYASTAPSTELRAELTAFLKSAGFTPQGNDEEFELWSDHHTVLGFSIGGAEGDATSKVEVVHNTGLD